MTQTQQMILGANRFFFYAMNYPTARIEYKSIRGDFKVAYVPDFFNAFPLSIIEHLIGKWEYCCKHYYGPIMHFYEELSSNHREEMLAWIMENYDDEEKIYFGRNNLPFGMDFAIR